MGRLFASMLLYVSFPLIYMQHDHILKKFNFGLGHTPHYKVHPADRTQVFKLSSRPICFIIIVPVHRAHYVSPIGIHIVKSVLEKTLILYSHIK